MQEHTSLHFLIAIRISWQHMILPCPSPWVMSPAVAVQSRPFMSHSPQIPNNCKKNKSHCILSSSAGYTDCTYLHGYTCKGTHTQRRTNLCSEWVLVNEKVREYKWDGTSCVIEHAKTLQHSNENATMLTTSHDDSKAYTEMGVSEICGYCQWSSLASKAFTNIPAMPLYDKHATMTFTQYTVNIIYWDTHSQTSNGQLLLCVKMQQ